MGLLEGLLDLLYGTSLAAADGAERTMAQIRYIVEQAAILVKDPTLAVSWAKNQASSIMTQATDYAIDTFAEDLNKNPDKYKEKITSVHHGGFINLGSIVLPKADVERLLAALNLIGMNSMKSSMATYFNTDAKIISFDIANYYIDKLTRYNNRNSIGIDPVINSAFKGQIRVNNFIIKNLRIYTAEKTSFKKYQQEKSKNSKNHQKYLTEVLSSLKKMYNALYVILKKIDNNNIKRFSSKEAFAYYLNTYTPDDKTTPDEVSKKVETWDDTIEHLKDIIKNTLDNNILPDLKTIKNQINNPLIDDPTSDDANNLKKILDILDKYSNPNGTAKKSPPYNPKGKKDIKEKIKKFGSKVIGNISLQGANYFLNLSNNILLDSRMLLCPYIVTCTAPSDRKAVSPSIPNYLGFKTAKDITDFLKEYNDISYKLSDDWLRYIDIPNQRALNKNLISKLEEYRSVKYKIEKTLNSEKINPKDLINVKIDLKKRLEKIKKICEDKRIESYGWKSEKLKKDYEIAMDSKNTSFPEGLKEKIKTLKNTFDFMKKSCDKNVSMLWEDYIKAIGEITENTIEGIDKIIALSKSSGDTEEIKVDFKILQMKKIEYKILNKKSLDKKINITDKTDANDITPLFEKDRYKESYEINIKNKKFTKLEQSLNNKYQEQNAQINNTITNIIIEYTYFVNLLSLINLLTTENSFFNQHEKKKEKNFYNRYKNIKEACNKIKEDYTKYMMGKSSTTQALEIALTLKNNIKMQKKYIVKLNDLYKEIIGYNKNLMEELLAIQKEFKKQKNKYDSAYKTFTKYINKHGIQSDIPYKNNDIFIKDWGKIKKEKIERIIQNLKKPVENAKKELENLQLDQKLKLNDKNLEQYKKSYRAYLSRIVDFLDKEIKKTIDLNELLRHK
ncbi:MAG: hypothetical protein IJI84_00135 [Clostridia bacterium]|nr:hypothetical protein [Clostridia bacterium]